MLRLDNVYWASNDPASTISKLKSLGLNFEISLQDPALNSVFFGPDALFFPGGGANSLTVGAHSDAGVFALGMSSTDVVRDYKNLGTKTKRLEKPKTARAKDSSESLWYGFNLPSDLTSGGPRAWVSQYSDAAWQMMSAGRRLPVTHANTAFGIESIAIATSQPEKTCALWAELLQRPKTGLRWTEGAHANGHRIVSPDKFLDFLPLSELKAAGRLANVSHEGVVMITVKVTDIERALGLARAANADCVKCENRDGFVVPSSFTGGPALRFVRAFWKEFLPPTSENYPKGRRTDKYHPLGNIHTSTLETGFADDWSY